MCLTCSSNRGNPKSWVKSRSVGCSFGNSPFLFHQGFLDFSCRRPEWPFPISFPHQCCRAEMWAGTNWVYQAAFHLIAGDSSEDCQMLWVTIALYGKKNQSLCWHKLPVCSMCGLASSLVTQRRHLSPLLMHCVTLRGVSSRLYFPSDHNLEVILQCSTGLKAGIWKPQSTKLFPNISDSLSWGNGGFYRATSVSD